MLKQKKKLLNLKLEKGWTKDDLYHTLSKIRTRDGYTDDLKKYKIKIYGEYDKNLIKEFYSCEYCPKNPHYSRFSEYNELSEEKIPVLVLSSDYYDFRKYDIYCSYYTNSEKMIEDTNMDSASDIDLEKYAYLLVTAEYKNYIDKIKDQISKIFS